MFKISEIPKESHDKGDDPYSILQALLIPKVNLGNDSKQVHSDETQEKANKSHHPMLLYMEALGKEGQDHQTHTHEGKVFRGPKAPKQSLREGEPTSMRPIMAIVPAIKDPKAAIPSAAPALPFLAIWYPSRHVTTDEDSPGILTRIEVVDPPYWAP